MMNAVMQRQMKYYLRLPYPLHITLGPEGFLGTYPDLGLRLEDEDLPRLYARLDEYRRTFLLERVAMGQNIPMPNSAN
jgi:hypothetical protein